MNYLKGYLSIKDSLVHVLFLTLLIHMVYFAHEILFWVSVPFGWLMVKITPKTKNTIQKKLLHEIVKKRHSLNGITQTRPGSKRG